MWPNLADSGLQTWACSFLLSDLLTTIALSGLWRSRPSRSGFGKET